MILIQKEQEIQQEQKLKTNFTLEVLIYPLKSIKKQS